MSHAAILSDEMYDSPSALPAQTGLLYERESSQIREIYFEVYKKYRRAFGRSKAQAAKQAEVVQALAERLMGDGFRITPSAGSRGILSGFAVDEKIFIHVAMKPHLEPKVEEQFGKLLKTSGCRLGFLINFGSDRLQVSRRIA